MTTLSSRLAPYDTLWTAAHEALLAGRWTDARDAVDALLAHHRHLATDRLPALDALPVAPLPKYRPVLEDRLRLWNAAVDRPQSAPDVEPDIWALWRSLA